MRLLLAAAIFAAAPVLAHDYEVGALSVGHPVIYEGPPTLRTAAGYMTVTNAGDEADSLIGIRSDAARASLHETREEDGVARMLPVEIVEIPAGGTVTFAPGGLHVMFMDVDGRALREGAELPATLVFERAGAVEVTFNVEPRSGGGEHGGDATH